MTRKYDRQPSMVDEAESNPTDALELAAARAAVEGSALLSRAFAETGLTQKDLALRVGVTEGRVSQILGEAVNLRLSTVGRYLQAMGYRLSLCAVDAEGTIVETSRNTVALSPTPISPHRGGWDGAYPARVLAAA